MVGERLLEHLVHGLEVAGDRQAVVVLGDPAHRDALAWRRERTRLALLGGDRPAHLEPGAGLPVARARRATRAAARRAAYALASSWVPDRSRRRGDVERGRLRPGEEGRGQARRRAAAGATVTSTTVRPRPGRGRSPRHDRARGLLDEHLAAGPGRGAGGRGRDGLGVHRARSRGPTRWCAATSSREGPDVLEAGDAGVQPVGRSGTVGSGLVSVTGPVCSTRAPPMSPPKAGGP